MMLIWGESVGAMHCGPVVVIMYNRCNIDVGGHEANDDAGFRA